MFHAVCTPEFFNKNSEGKFPGLLGIEIMHVEAHRMIAEMKIEDKLFAPNGFVHAGSIVTLADTVAGYSTIAHLPEGGQSFTTLELKCNFIRAQRSGYLSCESIPEHLGKRTHVWRVEISDKETHKKIALFSCTQLIL